MENQYLLNLNILSLKWRLKSSLHFFYIYIYHKHILINSMTLKIKDREVTLKYSFRCFFIFENIVGRSFKPDTTTDVLCFFYSCIMASDKELNLTFDEFLDMIDEKPELIAEFATFISEATKLNKAFQPESEEKKTMTKQEK